MSTGDGDERAMKMADPDGRYRLTRDGETILANATEQECRTFIHTMRSFGCPTKGYSIDPVCRCCRHYRGVLNCEDLDCQTCEGCTG